MTFISYKINFHTWTVWTAGLLVKDALTLTVTDDNTGDVFTVKVTVNYSARGYGKMTPQMCYWLDNRMLEKHNQYMDDVDKYRTNTIVPVLDALKGQEFKSLNNFVKIYNERAYAYYG